MFMMTVVSGTSVVTPLPKNLTECRQDKGGYKNEACKELQMEPATKVQRSC